MRVVTQIAGCFLLSLCLATCAKATHQMTAINKKQPFAHCVPLSLQKDIVLNNTKSTVPAVYYFYHAGRRAVVLDRVFHSTGAGAGWSSPLSPGHASLFVLAAHRRLVFSCQYASVLNKKVSCRPLLWVCQVRQLMVPKNMGSAWWHENQLPDRMGVKHAS